MSSGVQKKPLRPFPVGHVANNGGIKGPRAGGKKEEEEDEEEEEAR